MIKVRISSEQSHRAQRDPENAASQEHVLYTLEVAALQQCLDEGKRAELAASALTTLLKPSSSGASPWSHPKQSY